ncbi:MAG TPA: hypothetical protein VH206_15335 [Xanthobacteraceae bacterium]|nr:hypothetical protein [Xanthobacteraceae bacterium]
MPTIPQFGLWTCAGLYFAVGLCGLLFFSLTPNSANSADGYGVIHALASSQIAQR